MTAGSVRDKAELRKENQLPLYNDRQPQQPQASSMSRHSGHIQSLAPTGSNKRGHEKLPCVRTSAGVEHVLVQMSEQSRTELEGTCPSSPPAGSSEVRTSIDAELRVPSKRMKSASSQDGVLGPIFAWREHHGGGAPAPGTSGRAGPPPAAKLAQPWLASSSDWLVRGAEAKDERQVINDNNMMITNHLFMLGYIIITSAR